jgi:hypothetical protein
VGHTADLLLMGMLVTPGEFKAEAAFTISDWLNITITAGNILNFQEQILGIQEKFSNLRR